MQKKRVYDSVKGLLDPVMAALLLVILSPVFAVIWLIIKLNEVRHPAIFSQTRIGKNGQTFRIYKFRTMVVDAEEQLTSLLQYNDVKDNVTFKMKSDPRVTKIGRFLRKTSLDELPQLFNVIKGEMAIVGPRPALPREVAAYTEHEKKRLAVLPGITCLWQVSGRSDTTFAYMIEKDLAYIEQRSFGLDLMILFKTVETVVMPHGAY